MAHEIGFGIVGVGMIGAVQAAAIRQINNQTGGARLLAACGRDANRTAEFAAKFGAAGYTDYEAFLGHPGLQVVNVCTPSGTHAELMEHPDGTYRRLAERQFAAAP